MAQFSGSKINFKLGLFAVLVVAGLASYATWGTPSFEGGCGSAQEGGPGSPDVTEGKASYDGDIRDRGAENFIAGVQVGNIPGLDGCALSASSQVVKFRTVALDEGENSEDDHIREIQFTNIGAAECRILSVLINTPLGAGPNPFALLDGWPLGEGGGGTGIDDPASEGEDEEFDFVAPGDTHIVVVSYEPTEPGTHYGYLEVDYEDIDSDSIPPFSTIVQLLGSTGSGAGAGESRTNDSETNRGSSSSKGGKGDAGEREMPPTAPPPTPTPPPTPPGSLY